MHIPSFFVPGVINAIIHVHRVITDKQRDLNCILVKENKLNVYTVKPTRINNLNVNVYFLLFHY